MTGKLPRFSVVITLYNKERYIERAIRSVLAQTDSDFELLVIDDGSTDASRGAAAAVRDDRIRLISQPNAGEGAARNRGIDEARAEFVCFLDGDDEWTPSFLASIRGLIEAQPGAGIYATAYDIVEPEGQVVRAPIAVPAGFQAGILPRYFAACAAGTSPVWSSAVCVPRWVFSEIGRFAEGVSRGCDLDFWGRVAFAYPIAFTASVGAIYRRDAEGRACNTFRFQKPWIFFATARRFLAEHPAFPQRADVEDYLAERARADALECISLGDGDTARRILGEMTRPADRWRRRALALLSYAPPGTLAWLVAARRALSASRAPKT
ncbi:MAG: glycosyltransferase [Kofleriaceae bacterium]|nr:glycosyltransferase [Kofleriaceae bacterium]